MIIGIFLIDQCQFASLPILTYYSHNDMSYLVYIFYLICLFSIFFCHVQQNDFEKIYINQYSAMFFRWIWETNHIPLQVVKHF
jgi:hypothetical protein